MSMGKVTSWAGEAVGGLLVVIVTGGLAAAIWPVRKLWRAGWRGSALFIAGVEVSFLAGITGWQILMFAAGALQLAGAVVGAAGIYKDWKAHRASAPAPTVTVMATAPVSQATVSAAPAPIPVPTPTPAPVPTAAPMPAPDITRTGVSGVSVQVQPGAQTDRHEPRYADIEGVVGQGTAIASIQDTLRVAIRFGGGPGKPLASFLLAGPSGVGKTETAKALARAIYRDQARLARFDCNTSAGREGSQWRAFGPPPGYMGSDSGGELTQAVHALEGRCVILLDEVEKGGRELFDGLMTALDEGYIQDQSFGDRIPIHESIVVFTSNLVGQDTDLSSLSEDALRERLVAAGLRPEFVGRLGQVLAYAPLGQEAVAELIRIRWQAKSAEIRGKAGLAVCLSHGVAELAAKDLAAGGSGSFGARVIDRWLDEHLTRHLATADLDRQTVWVWVAQEGRIDLVAAGDVTDDVAIDREDLAAVGVDSEPDTEAPGQLGARRCRA